MISVNAQNSICIDAGKKIYFDPFEIDAKKADADYIFLTHDHFDHFSPDDMKKLVKDGTVIVCPQGMEGKVRSTFAEEVMTVLPGMSYTTADFSFETVPAYNVLKPFHTKKSGWVGYIVEIDGKRIYVAGDTDATREAEQVKCDIALVPIGGFYTMDYKDAAKLVNKIRPEVVIPTHYGGIVGAAEDGEKLKGRVDDGIEVVLKL